LLAATTINAEPAEPQPSLDCQVGELRLGGRSAAVTLHKQPTHCTPPRCGALSVLNLCDSATVDAFLRLSSCLRVFVVSVPTGAANVLVAEPRFLLTYFAICSPVANHTPGFCLM